MMGAVKWGIIGLAALLGSLGVNLPKINLEYSVEGLTVAAEVVACGQLLDAVTAADSRSGSFTRSRLRVTFAIKGAAVGDTLELTWWSEAETALPQEGLFFLESIPAPSTKEAPAVVYRPLRPLVGPSFRWLDLAAPTSVLTGHGFRRLTTEAEIVHACRRTAAAEREYRNQNWGEAPKLGYLKVPGDTEAFAHLYAGSACYLVVPRFMFREAKETP